MKKSVDFEFIKLDSFNFKATAHFKDRKEERYKKTQ